MSTEIKDTSSTQANIQINQSITIAEKPIDSINEANQDIDMPETEKKGNIIN